MQCLPCKQVDVGSVYYFSSAKEIDFRLRRNVTRQSNQGLQNFKTPSHPITPSPTLGGTRERDTSVTASFTCSGGEAVTLLYSSYRAYTGRLVVGRVHLRRDAKCSYRSEGSIPQPQHAQDDYNGRLLETRAPGVTSPPSAAGRLEGRAILSRRRRDN
eukprot:7175832-Pyramimonas_sp.AAC.1